VSPEEPFIVQYLGERVKSWKGNNTRLFIEPQNASFSFIECIAQELTLGFGELKWDISAVIPIVPKDEMDDRAKETFKRLKGMECQLKWKGLLKREPEFTLSPILFQQKKLLQDMELNPKLANRLGSRNDLKALLKIIKPEYLFFFLYLDFPEEGDYVFRIIHRYYRDPKELTWVITMGSPFLRYEIGLKKNWFLAIYDFFNEAGKILRDLSMEEHSQH
jgi:hypothetical protein